MKLTKGGIYMMQRCEEKGIFQEEEIIVLISQVFGFRRFGDSNYMRCQCQDGLGETATVYLEMAPLQPIIQKNEVILISKYINERKEDGQVIILIMSFKILPPSIPQENIKKVKVSDDEPIEFVSKKIRFNELQGEQINPTKMDSIDLSGEKKMFVPSNMNDAYQKESRVDQRKQSEVLSENEGITFSSLQSQFRRAAQDKSMKSIVPLPEKEKGNHFAQSRSLSEKLNKETFLVKDLKVGQRRNNFKFEGLILEKSQMKYTKDNTKHFFLRANDPTNCSINISFWTGVESYYQMIEVNKSYYFFGGEVKRFNNEIELKLRGQDIDVIAKDFVKNSTSNIQIHEPSFSPSINKVPTFQVSKTISAPSSIHSNNDEDPTIELRKAHSITTESVKFKAGICPKKQNLSISAVFSSTEQYVSVQSKIKECCKMEGFYKVTVQDENDLQELSILVFHELFKQWKDKLIEGKSYIFSNFARQFYKEQLQLKSNRFSSIELSQQDETFSKYNQDLESHESEQNEKIHRKLPKLNGFQSASQFYEKSRIANIKQITQKVEQQEEGIKSNYVVYANLISIQMNKKLYYFRCNCNNKGSLKSHGDSFFCSSCQDFVNPFIQLVLTAYIQDNTETIPVMMFHYPACFLVNDSDPSISVEQCGDFVKNCIDTDREDELQKVFARLDYRAYRFEITAEQKSFNQESEITYVVQRIDRKNPREEAIYMLDLLNKELINENSS